MKHLITFAFALIIVSCTTTKYVPVTQTEMHYVNVYDTLITHDTLTNNTTTIIRELDSLQMAQYGIQLTNAQKAWLIDRNSLERQISEMQKIHSDTIIDSIPVTTIVTETKTIPAELPSWMQFFTVLGIVFSTLALSFLLFKIYQYIKGK